MQVYRNIQTLIQKNFDHTHLTSNHGDPNMAKSFEALCTRLATSSPHSITPGRKTRHSITDLFDKGRGMMEKAEKEGGGNEEAGEEEPGEGQAGLEDIVAELL